MNNFGWGDSYGWFGAPFAIGFGLLMILAAVWTLVWKGLALWKAARLDHRGWFVVLLIINTLGILDILYIYIFSDKKKMKKIIEPAKPISNDGSDKTDATAV